MIHAQGVFFDFVLDPMGKVSLTWTSWGTVILLMKEILHQLVW